MLTVRRFIGNKEVTKEELHAMKVKNEILEAIHKIAVQRAEQAKNSNTVH